MRLNPLERIYVFSICSVFLMNSILTVSKYSSFLSIICTTNFDTLFNSKIRMV